MTGSEKNGTLYYPNEAFLSVAAMNYIMADSEFVENSDAPNINVYKNKFYSNKFNKDVITLYTTRTDGPINLYQYYMTDEVTLYDEYGNAKTMKSNDGWFYIEGIDMNVTYIVGDIQDFSVMCVNNGRICKNPSYDDLDLSNIKLKYMTLEKYKNTDFEMYAALYKDNRLTEVKRVDKEDFELKIGSNGEVTGECAISFDSQKSSADTFKVITVKSGGMSPMCRPLTTK